MELMKVPMGDIYPDEANPRDDFGDIEGLAESFTLTPERPGEPLNPPVVVRDGGIFRIVDGERRFRAMQRNGLASCSAYVCDGMEEADSMISMLATDDKQRLTELEKSRGVQKMLLLGVDPVKVEKAARVAPGTASRVKRSMSRIDDAAADMTLERLLAIEEFSDDADAVEELSTCKADRWEYVASELRRKRRIEEERELIREALKKAGCPIVDERPDGFTYESGIDSVKQLSSKFPDGFPDGSVAAMGLGTFGYLAAIYSPDKEEEISPEEEKRKRDLDAMAAAIAMHNSRIAAFFLDHLKDLASIPNASSFLKDVFVEENDMQLNRFSEENDVEIEWGIDETSAVIAYVIGNCTLSSNVTRPAVRLLDMNDPWGCRDYRDHLSWCEAIEADGFEPDENDKDIVERCWKIVSASECDGE